MTSVRKRTWPNSQRSAWQVDYRDSAGTRRSKQFERKKDADAFATQAQWEAKQGIHTADSQSITVAVAGQKWLDRARRENLEEATIDAYEQHVRLHIDPFLGARRLNQLTRPMIEEYRDRLLDSGRSRAMAKRVLASLSSIVKEAQRTGFVAQNVVTGVTVKRSGRDRSKIVVPTKDHMRALLKAAAEGRPMDSALLHVLIFAGLRASEIRALPWRNIDFRLGTITVDQRADFKNVIGPPKSWSGFRTISIPPTAIAVLIAWKARCPSSDLDLVFPSGAGTPIFHANLVDGFQEPIQIAAGICQTKMGNEGAVVDREGLEIKEGLYTLHEFRHAAASLWIEQRVAPKQVQAWMGHSSIQMTFDIYGHLFAALDDNAAVMASLEAALLVV